MTSMNTAYKEFRITDTSLIALEILKAAQNKKRGTATVIALSGDLGAGKTTLSQEIGKALGVRERLVSPTFVVMKRYEVDSDTYPWKILTHIDAYRLNHSNELMKLGWEKLLADKDNLIIVEWPENVHTCIPKNACNIKLSHQGDDTRTIEFLG